MRWGHRKAVPDSYASSKARYKAQREYKIEKAITADQRAAIRKKRVKTAAKVGAAIGVAALAAYGGYKVYKLQGDAVTSLGKKYVSMGDTHMHIARNRLDSSTSAGLDASRLAYQASTAKRSADRKVFSEGARNLRAISNERSSAAQESINTAKQYYSKAATKNYSRKEVVREMGNIARRRKRNDW